MNPNEIDLHKELKKYFGFNQFKGLQEQVVNSIIYGSNTFVIMPTGGGKSLCYQLPALVLDGTAIVVSPLIALMKNQVDAIRSLSSENGVAHVLNSSLTKTEINQVKADITSGVTKLLYVAPESLTKPEYIEFLQGVKLSFVAIDEAHCISEWGHDFRPEYRNLRSILEQFEQAIPIIALTATATPKVQEDIMKNLRITGARLFKASFNRPNLYYEIQPKINKGQTDKSIVRFIQLHKNKSGIIYTLNRKTTEELAGAYYNTLKKEPLLKLDWATAVELSKAYTFLDLKIPEISKAQEIKSALLTLDFDTTKFALIVSSLSYVDVFKYDFQVFLSINEVTELTSELLSNEPRLRGICIRSTQITREEINFLKSIHKEVICYEVRSAKGIRAGLIKEPTYLLTDDLKLTLWLRN